jgi:hypothetical protein
MEERWEAIESRRGCQRGEIPRLALVASVPACRHATSPCTRRWPHRRSAGRCVGASTGAAAARLRRRTQSAPDPFGLQEQASVRLLVLRAVRQSVAPPASEARTSAVEDPTGPGAAVDRASKPGPRTTEVALGPGDRNRLPLGPLEDEHSAQSASRNTSSRVDGPHWPDQKEPRSTPARFNSRTSRRVLHCSNVQKLAFRGLGRSVCA